MKKDEAPQCERKTKAIIIPIKIIFKNFPGNAIKTMPKKRKIGISWKIRINSPVSLMGD